MVTRMNSVYVLYRRLVSRILCAWRTEPATLAT